MNQNQVKNVKGKRKIRHGLISRGKKRIGTENQAILHRRPYCLNQGCECAPGFRRVKCGCRQCNSGSAAADQVTQMETLFDNMMDPFMPIYQCVNFVCKGRNCNNSYAEKFGRRATSSGLPNCDNDNSQNPFDIDANNFDNQFNFNNNSLGRPICRGNAIPLLPFTGDSDRRCVAGANTNAVNEFEREANRFENRFLLGDYQFQEA